ncbi:Eukaryotic translation initiation factor 3 subunit I [Castilleja foliolosa]|uniref:Eukaryotic translation initiation factor 3 subunit I n=1 Tax=Castilleja foliolosa TaxID=1961234 RepID=A0ABD3DSF0_9LAMI
MARIREIDGGTELKERRRLFGNSAHDESSGLKAALQAKQLQRLRTWPTVVRRLSDGRRCEADGDGCSQDCFKASWDFHKSVHLKANLSSPAPENHGEQNSGSPNDGWLYCLKKGQPRTSNIPHFDWTRTLKLIKTYERLVNAVAMSPLLDRVVLGGGQDASSVTSTYNPGTKFQAKFYDKILTEEIGGVKGHFGPINAL